MTAHQATERFYDDFGKLSDKEQEEFRDATRMLSAELARGRQPPIDLNVRRIKGFTGLYEMTFGINGRATFSVSAPVEGNPTIIWRRIGYFHPTALDAQAE
jgi:hypothetical protein